MHLLASVPVALGEGVGMNRGARGALLPAAWSRLTLLTRLPVVFLSPAGLARARLLALGLGSQELDS